MPAEQPGAFLQPSYAALARRRCWLSAHGQYSGKPRGGYLTLHSCLLQRALRSCQLRSLCNTSWRFSLRSFSPSVFGGYAMSPGAVLQSLAFGLRRLATLSLAQRRRRRARASSSGLRRVPHASYGLTALAWVSTDAAALLTSAAFKLATGPIGLTSRPYLDSLSFEPFSSPHWAGRPQSSPQTSGPAVRAPQPTGVSKALQALQPAAASCRYTFARGQRCIQSAVWRYLISSGPLYL